MDLTRNLQGQRERCQGRAFAFPTKSHKAGSMTYSVGRRGRSLNKIYPYVLEWTRVAL